MCQRQTIGHNASATPFSPPHQINLQVFANHSPKFRNFAADLGQSALNENI